MPCDSCNIVYLITCSNCREQYVGSTINFKQRFRIHKSDINSLNIFYICVLNIFYDGEIYTYKTNKDRCWAVGHFDYKHCSSNYKHGYLKVQIIEQVCNNNQCSIENFLWEWEQHWQTQLFTNLYVMNDMNDLYSMKKEGYQR